jgi:RHS repeat-associated protein
LQTKITYPNTKAVERAYDKDGRLEGVTDWNSNVTKFTYNADSGLQSTVFPSATKDEDIYGYNNADQMTEVKMDKSTEVLASLVYTRDSDGQVKGAVSKGLPGEEKPAYEYDTNNRLVKGAGTAYEYDAANNPTKIGTDTYKYNEGDQLETGPSLTYTYDELGERTKTKPSTGPATTYSYDQAGNLISVERPKEGETSEIKDSYTYNGEDLRASQIISGTTTYMAWDMAEELPLLLSDGTNSYIYGPGDQPIEQINNTTSTVSYMHHDQAGSTRLLTGSTGTVTGKCTYGAYGTPTCEGTTTTPLGYDAQYTSSDTGLIYLRKRTYDPATGQFLSIDPDVGLTRAPYIYTLDNPLNFSDPNGLVTVGTCLHVGGLFGEIVGYQGQACAVVSSSGDVGVTGSGGPTASVGTGAIDFGPSVQVTNATNIPELYRAFAQAGGSAALGLGGFGEAFTGWNSCGEQISGGDVGIAAGIGAEVHAGPTYTVGESVNIPSITQEVVEFPANAIKEINSGL